MRFTSYLFMRIISIILQIIGISIILFSLYAFTQYDVGIDHAEFGGQPVADAENQRLGTNYTYTEQFFNFWEGLLFGGCGLDIAADNCNRTLGISWENNRQANITTGQPIDDAMQQVFINSITIFMVSFIIYASIGVVTGVIAGVKSGKLDQILHLFTSALIGIPGVLVLIFIFRIFLDKRSLEFNILLVSEINIGSADTDTSILWYLIIPILSHALISLPFVFRYIR